LSRCGSRKTAKVAITMIATMTAAVISVRRRSEGGRAGIADPVRPTVSGLTVGGLTV
jgi:hypothetical protein